MHEHFAATAGVEQTFRSMLAEARTKTPSPGQTATVASSLTAAEWYWERNEYGLALDYLSLARGKLGLSAPRRAP